MLHHINGNSEMSRWERLESRRRGEINNFIKALIDYALSKPKKCTLEKLIILAESDAVCDDARWGKYVISIEVTLLKLRKRDQKEMETLLTDIFETFGYLSTFYKSVEHIAPLALRKHFASIKKPSFPQGVRPDVGPIWVKPI